MAFALRTNRAGGIRNAFETRDTNPRTCYGDAQARAGRIAGERRSWHGVRNGSASGKAIRFRRRRAAAVSPVVRGTDYFRPVRCILGIPVDAVSTEDARRIVEGAVERGERCFISTPNLNFLVSSMSDTEFRNSVIRSDLSLPDGQPLVWLARFLGCPVVERVAGASLFEQLRERCQQKLRLYIFGGPDGAAERAASKVNQQGGPLLCAGAESPVYGSVQDLSQDEYISRINDSKADFLVVSLGAKKGQAWIEENLDRIQVPVVSHLGAVVNLLAGRIRRAPPSVQRLGCEWLWRIKEEPILWRRYLHDGVKFLALIITRAIPAAMLSRKLAGNRAGLRRAHISIQRQPESWLLKLSGGWAEANLMPLRQALARVGRSRAALVLDMSRVEYLDAAAIGLLLLAYGHQSKQGRELVLHNVPARIRTLLHMYCVDHLLEHRSGGNKQSFRRG